MTQGEIEALSREIERNARNLEIDIMLDIVRRIKDNLDIEQSMTSSADYQIQLLRKMGYSDEFLKNEIKSYLKFSDEEIDRIYNQTSENLYKEYEDAFDAIGKKQTPFGKHPEIQPVVKAAIEQSKNTFQNITGSIGFTKNVNGKRQFMDTAKFYQRSLDEAVLGVATGAFSYDTVLKRIIKDMTRSGLRTVEYASGRTYRVDSACRTALMTGFRQIVGRMNEQVAAELDTGTYEVTYHMDGLGRISTKVGKKILSSMKISIPKEVVEKAGLDKSVEKKINQAIKKLDKEYTIYLDSIEGGKLGRGDLFVSGAYLDKDGMLKHGLVFNYNIDYNKFESRIKMLYSAGYMAGKSYEDYIAHEMAHIIPFQNCVTKKDYDELTDEIYKSFVKGISKYADKERDGRESLAEAFVRYRNGEKIPDESRKLIEKYILPWRRK